MQICSGAVVTGLVSPYSIPLVGKDLPGEALFRHGRLIERLGQRLEDGFHDVVRHAVSFLDGFRPTRTNVRKASFTDSEVRNIFATSGESTTTLLPSAYRFAYFPRTPLLKSYSGNMSSCLSRMSFFISISFAARGRTSTDDTDTLVPVRMHHYKQPAFQ